MSLFEVQSIDGMGKGCVATQDIPAGNVVFMEQPLLRIRNGATLGDYITAYQALSADQKTMVNDLTYGYKPDVSDRLNEALKKPLADGSYADARFRDTYRNMIMRFDNNSFHMEDVRPATDEDPEDKGTSGLFPQASRFNHSCDPNLIYSLEWTPGWWIARAKRDIKAGEELTITYIPIVRDVHDRRAALANWSFYCNCSACTADVADGAALVNLRRGQTSADLSGETTGPETNDVEAKRPRRDDGGDIKDDEEDDGTIHAQYYRLLNKIKDLEGRQAHIELFFKYCDMMEFCFYYYKGHVDAHREGVQGQDKAAKRTHAECLEYGQKSLALGTRIWGPADALVAEQTTFVQKCRDHWNKFMADVDVGEEEAEGAGT